MSDVHIDDALRDELRGAWHRFVDLTTPLRPGLHRYCRRLTGDLWEAEDLVQDTLLKSFATLGSIHHSVRNPAGFLFRVATNLWIDGLRARAREQRASVDVQDEKAETIDPTLPRDAGAALLQRLSPQERAAVLLRDLFDQSIAEIADTLATTEGAVKAALHRGRGRLAEPEPPAHRPRPSVELVERFVAAYNAQDLDALLALMLDGGTAENVGCGVQFGYDAHRDDSSWFRAAIYGHASWPAEFRYESARMVRAELHGEPVVLGLVTRRGREALEQVIRLEERDAKIARLRAYAFCPETMREIGAELKLHVRTGLYRYPTPEPGRTY